MIPREACTAIQETSKAIHACASEEQKWLVIWAVMKSAMAEGQKAGIDRCFEYFNGFHDLPGGMEGFEKAHRQWEAWERKQYRIWLAKQRG